jgi:CDP-glucose 4,6-dehydratase
VAGLGVALVTGGHGLLGAWLVKALLDRGAQVVLVAREGHRRSALAIEGSEAHCAAAIADVRDGEALDRAFAEHQPDTVFHLAAQSIVGTANRDPGPTFDANVRGTWTVLEACRRHGVARAVVASSDKVYGPAAPLPYREDLPLDPRYPYDVSKAAADVIARSYWHTYGVPVAVTRFGNVYGGGDLNTSRLIPEAVAAALAHRAPVVRSDGTPERDFLYVEDAVDAYLALAAALDDPDAGARGEAFNGGGERPHSVLEVLSVVCAVAGVDVEPDVRGTGTPSGEIDREQVDSAKLRRTTGWAPRVDLEEGLRRTIA